MMFSRFRARFGTPGVLVAVIALVFAMAGGAYAASGGLSGKQKKEVEKIAKKYAGKPGKPGKNGAPGAQGAKGDTGAAGAAGAKGDTGATGLQGPKGDKGDPGEEGPEGPEGSPWTAGGVLPSKKTETGTWGSPLAFWEEANVAFANTAVSFPIPLPADLDENHVVKVESLPAPAECENAEHAGEASAENPEAKPGFLCVYVQAFLFGGELESITNMKGESGAESTGAVLTLISAATQHFDSAYGTFAVTAP